MSFFSPRQRLQTTTFLTGALVAAFTQPAHALPQGGNVVGGQAAIGTAGSHTEVTQASNRALIEWNNFDVRSSESVNFAQPSASAIALNRVVGSQAASQIDGKLSANGNLIIVNSQGVMFGAGAEVNVGGLVASTADIDNDRFMNGDLTFDRPGNPNATVSNRGSIKIADGGLALLVGPNVTNDGLIQAKLGKVQLASGDTFTVDLYGDGLLSLEASDQLSQQLVQNKGKIEANGGEVLLTAAAAQNTVQSVINMDGLIQANSVGSKNGKVVLSAAGSNAAKKAGKNKTGHSTVLVSGTIDATGKNAGEKGGTVEVLGDHVAILTRATIDASGDAGGGVIRVGGDYHGEGDTPTALHTIIQSDSSLLANALSEGNGGNVTVWADGSALFAGNIEAKGGAISGNGGFVETSGREYLDAFGNVNASAPNGKGGLWLLDPNNITITDSPNTDSNVTGNPNFTTTANTGRVSVASIQSNLNSGTSVTITTGTAGTNTQDGDITVAKDIAKTSGTDATLTLNAHDDIFFSNNANITSTSGKLNVTLNADSDASGAGAIQMGSNSSIESNGGNIILGGGGSPSTNAATGHSGQVDGVDLDGATLNAAGGNISIRGKGFVDTSSDRRGVRIRGGAVVQTSGTGTITITGQGGGGGNGDDNYGVQVTGNNSTISAVNGAITITGTGGGSNTSASKNNYGVGLITNTTITSTGSGSINVTGTAGGDQLNANGNDGIHINGGTNNIGGGSTTGNITLTADTLDVSNTLAVQTTGNVTLKTLTNSTTIGIAGASGGLQLTSAILNSITAGKIVVGSTAGTGTLTANAYTWNATANLLTGSGNIVLNGVQTMGGHTFLANTASGDISIGASGGVTSNASGDAIVLAATSGDFTNSGGASALSAPSGRWLVYSTDPANNTLGGLSEDFYRYSCTYGGACPSFPSTGNGLLYTVSPTLLLTINPDAKSTTYGQAAPSFTYTLSGYNSGDEALDVVTGAPVITTNYVIGNSVGSYNIISAAGTLNSSLGYNFTGTTLTGGLTVNAAPLSITANNQNITYGGGNNLTAGFSSSGLYGSETIGSVSLATNATSATSGNWNAGTWNITASGASGGTFNPSNYIITYNNGTLTIGQKALSVSATASDKVYDGNTTASATFSDDRISGDILTVGSASADFDDKNAGNNKTVTVLGINISGTDSGNYSLSNTTDTDQAKITKRDLTITATADNKVYDGTRDATVTLSDDRVAGDSFTDSYNQARFDTKNVGTDKTVTVTGIDITGTDAGNYTFNHSASDLADITAGILTITANDQSQTYGDGNNLAAGFSSSGLQSGDVIDTVDLSTNATSSTSLNWNVGTWSIGISNAAGIAFDPNNYTINYVNGTLSIAQKALNVTATASSKVYDGNDIASVTLFDDRISGDDFATSNTSAAFSDKNVANGKTVTVSGIAISGTDAGNYTANTDTTTTADITPAALTVTANDQSQTYGDGNNLTAGFDSSGLQGTDAIDTVDLTTDATSSTSLNWNAGTWSIIGSNAAGVAFDANNYTITYVDGTLTVDPKALNVTATASNKVYDGNTTASVTLFDDRISGDDFTASNSSADFSDKNVANGKTVTVSGIAISGTDAGNYTANTDTTTTADITPATLTVTADDQTKVYGSADPALTFGFSGFVGGDDSSLFTGGLTRDPGENVAGSPYAIEQGSLSAGGNYLISYTGGVLVITPATLTITADDQFMLMGDAIPPLTFQTLGLVNGDDLAILTGGLSTVPAQTLPGLYSIDQGTLAANDNYTISYTAGTLTIESPFGINNSQEQTSDFAAGNFRGPQAINTLLAMSNNAGPSFNPAALGNLSPAAGGNPSDLANLSPSAGGLPTGGEGAFALIQCDQDHPCDTVQ